MAEFDDLNPETSTCRLCGDRWGEGHDFIGRCNVYNKDGTRTRTNINGWIPPFQGPKPERAANYCEITVRRRVSSSVEATKLGYQAAERGWEAEVVEYHQGWADRTLYRTGDF